MTRLRKWLDLLFRYYFGYDEEEKATSSHSISEETLGVLGLFERVRETLEDLSEDNNATTPQ